MIELQGTRRNGRPACSEAVVTDRNWYRIGFTCDGVRGSPYYLDGCLVTKEAPVPSAASDGGRNIGCSNNMAPGTFWSGLIDDVRIYDRAVKP